ncbi:hypothetical protein PMI01_03022 [Caulobacter sp. AP07]|nr:hypothetical protein PMI01_03022 [Caulobacter sp. AP07]
MHTAFDLNKSMFALTVDGQAADRDVLLDWEARDRLGVIIDRPVGALGAGLLTLMTITAFYDVRGKKRRQRPLYPDIFLIHAGGPWGPFVSFDFWPDHKEVFVEAEPRELLRGINHLGLTHLALPDRPRAAVVHRFKEPEAARDRLKMCFAYGPDGRVEGGDIAIRSDHPAVFDNFDAVLNIKRQLADLASAPRSSIPRRLQSTSSDENKRAFAYISARAQAEARPDHPDHLAAAARLAKARGGAGLTETLRRVSVDCALEMLG